MVRLKGKVNQELSSKIKAKKYCLAISYYYLSIKNTFYESHAG